MNYKKLILPIGTALAALISNDSEAAKVPSEVQKDLAVLQDENKTRKDLKGSPIKELQYQMGEQAHTLTLHKSSSGALFAQHRSHSSHSSHASHASHRSSGY